MLPGYGAIGVASPLLLVALRFVQGVALGGEWAGAVLLSMEHGRQDRRGLNASWTHVGPSAGTLLATGIIALLTANLGDADFLGWGWRVPFLASLVLVGFGFWVRLGVEKSPMFKELEAKHETAEAPVGEVMTKHWRRLLIAGGSRVGSDVLYALVVVFTLTYVTTVLHLPRAAALTAVLVGASVNAVCVPLCGLLSDRFGRRPVYGVGVVAEAAWAFLFFTLLDTKMPRVIVLSVTIGLAIQAVMYGPQAAFVTEQFQTRRGPRVKALRRRQEYTSTPYSFDVKPDGGRMPSKPTTSCKVSKSNALKRGGCMTPTMPKSVNVRRRTGRPPPIRGRLNPSPVARRNLLEATLKAVPSSARPARRSICVRRRLRLQSKTSPRRVRTNHDDATRPRHLQHRYAGGFPRESRG